MKQYLKHIGTSDFIISDEEIKLGDYGIDTHYIGTSQNPIVICNESNKESIQEWWNKITHSNDPSHNLPKFLIVDEELEKLARENANKELPDIKDIDDNDLSVADINQWNGFYFGFIAGYTKAKENCYSKLEIEKAMEFAMKLGYSFRKTPELQLMPVQMEKEISDYLQTTPTEVLFLKEENGISVFKKVKG